MILLAHERNGVADVGAGFWCPIFYGVAGVLGLLAAWKPTTCSVVSFMVLSIIASLFTIPLVTFSGIGFGQANSWSYYTPGKDIGRFL